LNVELRVGGDVDWLGAYDDSTITMSGGYVEYDLSSSDLSNVTMSGGTVARDLDPWDSSIVTLTGGEVSGLVWTAQTTTFAMSGGNVLNLVRAEGNSIVTLTGGEVHGMLVAWGNSTVAMSGGTAWGSLVVEDTATLTINGTSFMVDGKGVPLGNLTALNGNLTGNLIGGGSLSNPFSRDATAKIRLIPEPSHAVLLGSALLGLLALARRGPAWRRRTRA
jgi:hypothetical protein